MDPLREAMHPEASDISPLGDLDRDIQHVSNVRRRLTGLIGLAAAVTGLVVALAGPWWRPTVLQPALPQSTPSPAATPHGAPGTVTGYFAGSKPYVAITYTLPDGWVVGDDPFLVRGENSVVSFWDVDNVYADSCQWTPLDPGLGPTVDDLARVWAQLPGLTATSPADITIDGYPGKRVDFTLPDYDEADCLAGKFALWTEDHAGGGPHFWAQVPKQQNRQWIIDVDGTRLVINEWSKPGTTPAQLAEMDQLLASVQIG